MQRLNVSKSQKQNANETHYLVNFLGEHALTCWSNSKQKLKGNYGKSVQCQVRIIKKLKKSSKIEYHHSMKVLIVHSTVGIKVGH